MKRPVAKRRITPLRCTDLWQYWFEFLYMDLVSGEFYKDDNMPAVYKHRVSFQKADLGTIPATMIETFQILGDALWREADVRRCTSGLAGHRTGKLVNAGNP